MSAPALLFDLRDTAQTLDGMTDAAQRLIYDFGVDIAWTELDDDHGQWDGAARTLLINATSPIADQCCVLIEGWLLCAVGPHALANMVPDDRRHLHAV